MIADFGHGHYRQYVDHRCRCNDCRQAWAIYNARRQMRGRAGTVWADMDQVRQSVAPLIEQGIAVAAIARAAGGISRSNLKAALEGKKKLRWDRGEQVKQVTFDSLDDSTFVDASMAVAVLERLEQAGVTKDRALIDGLGWHSSGQFPTGPTVTLGTVRRLEAYAEHVETHCKCGRPKMPGGAVSCLTCFQKTARGTSRGGCGSAAGYARHRREGTPPCAACKEGHAAYNRERKWRAS